MFQQFNKFLTFLSTPSARRATVVFQRFGRFCCISIHALREEGDAENPERLWRIKNFYPHPPRGGRPQFANLGEQPVKFLSTPSARRATIEAQHIINTVCISIHALREEGDGQSRTRQKLA